MKKIISYLLICCMLFAAVASTVPTASAEVTHGYLLGDANDDGDVTLKDVLLVRRFVAGVISEKELDYIASDTNYDSEVTLADVLTMRKAVAGVISLDGNNTDGLYRVSTVTVGKRNIARYTVVITTDDERMRYAANEFTKYINKECGVALNVTLNEEEVKGYKIRYAYDAENAYELGKEGYRVVLSESGDVDIYCGSLRGPLYATYFLLEQLGWRFLAAGENWNGDSFEYVYKAETVDLPEKFDVTEVPYFSYRAIGMGGCTSENFAMLRANAVDGSGSNAAKHATGGGEGALYIHGHSFGYLMMDPSDRYHNTTLSQYINTQPCLTSEETFERMYNYCTDLIEERKVWGEGQKLGLDYTQISCSANDNTDFCDCSSCKKVYEVEGSVGGTIFRFVNRMSEALDAYCPGIEVFTIAHWEARQPTKFTRPNDNVVVCFRLGGCNNHSFLDTESCDAFGGNPRLQSETGNNLNNSEDTALYEAWADLTSNLYAWYCSDNLSYYITSSPNLFNIYEDFKYMAQVGTRGIYCEGCDKPFYAFEFLRGYMISKMMWNPFMSEEEYNSLMNECLSIWYGDGWEYIREYIELEDAASDELGCFRNNFDRPWNLYNEKFFRENYDYLRGLFEKAAEGADDAQKRRLEITLIHVDFFGLSATYESDYENGDGISRAKYLERYHALWDSFEKYEVVMTNWSGGKHGGENFPDSRDTVYKPMTWLMSDFSGYWEKSGNGSWV